MRLINLPYGRVRPGAKLIVAIAVLAGGLSHPALAKRDVEPLTVTRDQELRFGQLTVLANSAEVQVPSMGLPSYQNAVRVSGPVGPARFVIRGEPGQKVDVVILMPSSGTFGHAGKATVDRLDMSVEFSRDFDPDAHVVTLRLDSSGTNVLTIGGRLSLLANDSSGTTTIPIPISASYSNSNLGDPAGPGGGNGNGKDNGNGNGSEKKKSVDYE